MEYNNQRYLAQQAQNERRDMEAKREADAGKAAEYFVKAQPGVLDALGMNEGEFQNLSARDQASAISGFMEAQAVKKYQASEAAQAALERAVQSAGRETMSMPGTASAAMGAPTAMDQAMGPVQANVPVPVTSQRLRTALGQNPQAVNAPNFDNLLRAMQVDEMTGQPALPQAFDVGGIKGIYSPRTGAIHTQGNPTGLTFDQRLDLLDRKGLLDEKRSLISAMGNSFGEDKVYYKGQIDQIDQRLKAGRRAANAAEEAAAPASPPSASILGPDEVIRITPDGKRAVFNAKTRKFLRYAN